MRLFTFMFSFMIGFVLIWLYSEHDQSVRISAFIRVKDEVKTVIPCLESIDGLFDRMIIIHSNESDDGSVKVMQKWCRWRLNCHIYEYPHAVIPSHKDNQKQIPYENSLAAYYNFGLEKFNPEEYVAKIDADQIYIRSQLAKTLNFIREKDAENDALWYGIKGYNTYPHKGKLVLYKQRPFNGGKDAFIVKRKYMKNFYNNTYYETIDNTYNLPVHIFNTLHWFHFMKILKSNGVIRPANEAKDIDIKKLSDAEKELFNLHIRPLLEKHKSIYKNLSFE